MLRNRVGSWSRCVRYVAILSSHTGQSNFRGSIEEAYESTNGDYFPLACPMPRPSFIQSSTNAYLISRNFFIVLRGFFPNKFAEKITIFNEFFISLHASHSLPRYALCCLVSDFLLRILNSGVEVTLLQQLGWINLCELAFYIYIYIYIYFFFTITGFFVTYSTFC